MTMSTPRGPLRTENIQDIRFVRYCLYHHGGVLTDGAMLVVQFDRPVDWEGHRELLVFLNTGNRRVEVQSAF